MIGRRARAPPFVVWAARAEWGLCAVLCLSSCSPSRTIAGSAAREGEASAVAAPAADRLAAAQRLFDSGALDAARDAMDELLRDEPEHPRRDFLLLLAAECAYRQGDLEGAHALYVDLLATRPQSRAIAAVPLRLYEIGKALLEQPPVTVIDELARDYRTAADALGRVAVDFPRSRHAADAWMRLADLHLKEGRPDLAVLAYQRLLASPSAPPQSALAEEATWRIAIAQRARSRGSSYDPRPLLDARDAAVAYLKAFGPGATFAADAAALILDATRELIAHESAIADFYAARGNAAGAALHRANVDRLRGGERDGGSLDLLRAGAP